MPIVVTIATRELPINTQVKTRSTLFRERKAGLIRRYPNRPPTKDVARTSEFATIIALAKISNVVNGINFGEVEPWVQSAGDAWIRWEANAIIVANSLVLATRSAAF